MKISLPRRAAAACLVAGGCVTLTALAQDDPAPAGVLWQTTSQVKMEGMPFGPPPNKVKVCAAAGTPEPPGSADEDRGCVNSDFVQEGHKVTWNSFCDGPPEMTGHGEITYAEDQNSYSGAIRYETADGIVTIQLNGERIGDCENPR